MRKGTSFGGALEPKLVLIVANGRTGTTWLSTALGTLPRTMSDFEVKVEGYAFGDSHFPICHRSELREKLISRANLYTESPVTLITKVALDDERGSESWNSWVQRRQALHHLSEVFSDAYVVHLMRNYCGQIESARISGGNQLITSEASLPVTSLEKEMSLGDPVNRRPWSDGVCPPQKVWARFSNDVALVEAFGALPNYVMLNYEDLPGAWNDLMQQLKILSPPSEMPSRTKKLRDFEESECALGTEFTLTRSEWFGDFGQTAGSLFDVMRLDREIRDSQIRNLSADLPLVPTKRLLGELRRRSVHKVVNRSRLSFLPRSTLNWVYDRKR